MLGKTMGLASWKATLDNDEVDSDFGSGCRPKHSGSGRRYIHHRTLPILHDLSDFELQGSELVNLDL
jgi:hypothetical protein